MPQINPVIGKTCSCLDANFSFQINLGEIVRFKNGCPFKTGKIMSHRLGKRGRLFGGFLSCDFKMDIVFRESAGVVFKGKEETCNRQDKQKT